jgi:hypothetical protein
MKYKLILFIALLASQVNHNTYYMQWVFGYEDDSETSLGASIIDFNYGLVEIREYNTSNNGYYLGRKGSVICETTGNVELISNICDLRDSDFRVISGAEVLILGRRAC